MTHDEAIEAAARAILDAAPARLEAEFLPIDAPMLARAVAPILMEHGARLMQEAAASEAWEWHKATHASLAIRALDPAAIVKLTA